MGKITVRIPATTANLGPGFDCLGIALDIYNQVTVKRSDRFSITISGEGKGILPEGKNNMVYQGIAALYRKIGQPVPEISVQCRNEIPLARGLGSSAAAVVGGVVAANLLCGESLSPDDLLHL